MLTDAKIKALRPSNKRYIEWDERDGLGVRVSVNGKKSFIVAYRFEGRSRMMTLGEYPKDLKLKKARTKASTAIEDIAKGNDGCLAVWSVGAFSSACVADSASNQA